jgi:hypothetical protein
VLLEVTGHLQIVLSILKDEGLVLLLNDILVILVIIKHGISISFIDRVIRFKALGPLCIAKRVVNWIWFYLCLFLFGNVEVPKLVLVLKSNSKISWAHFHRANEFALK